ncbi:hypothetical protein H4R21_000834, partial [Coemansia helicoidea]
MTTLAKGELSQLLVGGGKKTGASIDSALDSLFANAPPAAAAKQPAARPAPFAIVEKGQDDMDIDTDAEDAAPKKPKRAKKAKGEPAAPEQSAAARQDSSTEAKVKRARRAAEGSDGESDDDGEEAAAKPKEKALLGRMPQDPAVLKRTLFVGNLTV